MKYSLLIIFSSFLAIQCRVLVSWEGIKPETQWWKCGILTSELTGNSPNFPNLHAIFGHGVKRYTLDFVNNYIRITNNNIILLYLNILFCRTGSSLLQWLLSSSGEWWPLSSCNVRTSHCGGFSHLTAQALEPTGFSSFTCWALELWLRNWGSWA